MSATTTIDDHPHPHPLDTAITRWRAGTDGAACHDELRAAHDAYRQDQAAVERLAATIAKAGAR